VEEMNAVLRRVKSKEETFGSSSNVLQMRLEQITKQSHNINNVLEEAEGSVNDKKAEMIHVLEKNINDVKERMTEYTGKINVEALISASTPSAQALDELNKTKKKFDDFRKRALTYNQYQETLDAPVIPLKEITEFDKKWDLRFKLWKCRDTWDENHRHWFHDNFAEVDTLDMEKKVKEYERDMMYLKQNLSRDTKDEVLEKLMGDVKVVSINLGLIMYLGNKALKPRHWKKIFALLSDGQSWAPSKTYTLQDLFNSRVEDVADKVEEISSQATGEYQIETSLNEIQTAWQETMFTVLPYRDIKDRYLIGAIEESTQ
jgi:hypothetical protein